MKPHDKIPSDRELRQFEVTLLLCFGLIGWLLFRKGHPSSAFILWGGTALVSGISVTIPSWGRVLFRMWMTLGGAIGFVTNRIVLTLVFYLVITPVAIVFRWKGRDALRLRIKKESATTYWLDHPPMNDKSNYEHIF